MYYEIVLRMAAAFFYGSHQSLLWEIKIMKQEGHDGPVSLNWLILGNLFKTEGPEEGLKSVAMNSNKKISKYFTK